MLSGSGGAPSSPSSGSGVSVNSSRSGSRAGSAQHSGPLMDSSDELEDHSGIKAAVEALEAADGGVDAGAADGALVAGVAATHAEAKSSVNSSVFVLSATTLGAGILALPYAFSLLGFVFAGVLLVVIGLVSSYAIRLLLQTAERVGACTYEELGGAIFPKFGKQMVVTTTLVLIFGSLTAFFVIIGDTIAPAVQSIVGSTDSFWVQKKVLLVIVAIVVVFPLCMLRSIHALERWSFLAVGIILVFSVLIVVDSIIKLSRGTAGPDSSGDNPSLSSNVHAFYVDVDLFEALPIICLAFTCQTMVFPIFNSLAGETPHSRAPTEWMQRVANRALFLCGCTYLPVGLFGFIAFGRDTKSDVLNNLPQSIFYDIVRAFFTLAICIHYPVVQFGFRSAILSTWYNEKSEAENRTRFWVITVLACLCSLILAILIPDLATVFSLTGAVCAFPYCYMFPTLFYLRLHQPNSGVQYVGSKVSSSESYVQVAVVPASDEYQRLNRNENGDSDVRLYHPLSTSTTGAPSTLSPLLSAPPGTLTTRESVPAWILLGVASVLWIISIVVSFKAMLDCLVNHKC